jgi:hypothetical protein
LKQALDARRAEDQPELEDEKANQTLIPLEGMGEMMINPDTKIGQEMLKLEQEMNQPGYFEDEEREYGAGERPTLD